MPDHCLEPLVVTDAPLPSHIIQRTHHHLELPFRCPRVPRCHLRSGVPCEFHHSAQVPEVVVRCRQRCVPELVRGHVADAGCVRHFADPVPQPRLV